MNWNQLQTSYCKLFLPSAASKLLKLWCDSPSYSRGTSCKLGKKTLINFAQHEKPTLEFQFQEVDKGTGKDQHLIQVLIHLWETGDFCDWIWNMTPKVCKNGILIHFLATNVLGPIKKKNTHTETCTLNSRVLCQLNNPVFTYLKCHLQVCCN